MIIYPTDKLQKVLLSGKCEQNGTPSPDNPADIWCNNGVLKVNRNLYSTEYHNKYLSQSDGVTVYGSTDVNISAMVNCTNVKSFMVIGANSKGAYRIFKYRPDGTFIDGQTAGSMGEVLVLPSDCGYFRIQYVYTSRGVNTENILIYNSAHNFGIYTDGTVEQVTDNLGNTANAEMLLSVGDYKDTQEVLTGAVTRNIGIKVLDGTEDWRAHNTLAGWFYLLAQLTLPYNTPALCTHYPHSFGQKETGVYFSLGRQSFSENRFIIVDSVNFPNTGMLTEFKQYLADQYANGTPVIIVYPLINTPITEQVTPQPLAGNLAIVTAGSIDNLPIESSTIAELKKRYIGDKEVKRVYIGDNIVYNN